MTSCLRVAFVPPSWWVIESNANTVTTIRLFLRQVVAQNGLPFELRPNVASLRVMEEAKSVKPRFSSAQERSPRARPQPARRDSDRNALRMHEMK